VANQQVERKILQFPGRGGGYPVLIPCRQVSARSFTRE